MLGGKRHCGNIKNTEEQSEILTVTEHVIELIAEQQTLGDNKDDAALHHNINTRILESSFRRISLLIYNHS